MPHAVTSPTQRVSMLVVLACVGTLLVITACGFVPQARPSSPPDTFILKEDSESGHVLGHGTLRLTSNLRATAEIKLYGQPGDEISTVELQGPLLLTFPRHLLLRGSSGKDTVSLTNASPGPFTAIGDTELLPFTGRLKFQGTVVTRQTPVRAELYAEDRFLLHLPANGPNGQIINFNLAISLWPGDRPQARHIAAELYPHAPCHDIARSDENVSTPVDGPFALDLKTTQGAIVHLQFAQPLDQVRARAGVLEGSITFTGGPCSGQRYTLDGTRF